MTAPVFRWFTVGQTKRCSGTCLAIGKFVPPPELLKPFVVTPTLATASLQPNRPRCAPGDLREHREAPVLPATGAARAPQVAQVAMAFAFFARRFTPLTPRSGGFPPFDPDHRSGDFMACLRSTQKMAWDWGKIQNGFWLFGFPGINTWVTDKTKSQNQDVQNKNQNNDKNIKNA